MFRKLCLGLLLSTTLVWAQPEGPYTAISTPLAPIHHIYLVARNDSVADLFLQLGGESPASAGHAVFSFVSGAVEYEPEWFPNADGWTRTLEDAIRVANGWKLAAYDLAENYNYTRIFSGADSMRSVLNVDSGLNWCPDQMPLCGSSVSSHLHFTSRDTLVDLNWTDLWTAHADWFWEAGTDYTVMPLFGECNLCQHVPFGTFGFMEGAALPLSPDSTLLMGWSPWGMGLCVNAAYDCIERQDISCSVAPIKVLLTLHGRIMALCETRRDGEWSTTQRLVEIDTVAGTCNDLLTLDANPLAATSDPNFGFAWLSQPSSGLLLSRADTTGVLVQPAGVIYWPPEGTQVTGRNIAMSENGKIMVVWTTEEIINPGATILWIEAVNWYTPLSANPPSERTAVRRYELNAYPNPFNASVRISYDLPRAGEVQLDIFDLLGRHVQTLMNQPMTSGTHDITWSPEETSGLYFVSLHAGAETRVQKIMYVK